MNPFPDNTTAFIGISQHLAEYADAVDSADFDRLEALLTEATVILLAGEQLVGGAAIRGLYEQVYAPVSPVDGHRRIKHHVTNLRVGAPDTEGVYPVDVYYFVYVVGDHGPALKSSGRYRQRIQWREGRWVILRHEIRGDL